MKHKVAGRRSVSLLLVFFLILVLLTCSLSPLALITQAQAAETSEGTSLPELDTGINTTNTAEIQSKSEVIYALLSYDGSVDDAIVVNHFRLSSEGQFSDYGTYRETANLSNTASINTSGDKVTLAAAQGEFYYQGTLKDPELPWVLSFTYTLDGKTIPASEVSSLGGERGRLGISLAASARDVTDMSFYEHYTLQISLTLPTENVSNISAEGAVVVAAGSNTQVSYTVLPGSDESYTFAADFDAINMPGISVAAVPFGMNFDLPDTSSLSGELAGLVSAINELSLGTNQLSAGADTAASGLEVLASGSTLFNSGLVELNTGSSSLSSNSSTLSTSLAQTVGGLQQLQQSGALDSLPDPSKEQLYAAIGALGEISGGYTQLDGGIQSYTQGLDALTSNYAGLNAGVSESASGARQLGNAAHKLSSGTGQLFNSVQTMPEDMQARIDEFAAQYDFSGFEPHSFVSSKNPKVDLVQFVFATPAIELPEEIEDAEEAQEESSILDKFVSLFTGG